MIIYRMQCGLRCCYQDDFSELKMLPKASICVLLNIGTFPQELWSFSGGIAT